MAIRVMPDPLLVVLFVVSVIAVSAENLNVSSREFPRFCSVLCLHSSMFSYPCVKMVEFHHPSFFFKGKMFIRIPKCCPVWHSGRKFVHYDMFLPVTFTAKKQEVSLITCFQQATTFR